MKQNRTVILCELEEGNRDWPPSDPTGFISWFEDKISLIPIEHRKSIKIIISSETYYECVAYAIIIISYERPETDEEEMARELKKNVRKK